MYKTDEQIEKEIFGNKMIATGNKSEFGQPLFKCEECKKEHTCTYPLFKSEL